MKNSKNYIDLTAIRSGIVSLFLYLKVEVLILTDVDYNP